LNSKLPGTIKVGLVLGTAQFVGGYGVSRQNTRSSAAEMLNAAFDNHFLAVDTAPAYGSAESEVGLSWRGQIHTKFDKVQEARESVKRSLKATGRRQLDLVYLHDSTEVLKRSQSRVLSVAEGLLEEEVVLALGASIYDEPEFYAALEDPRIAAVQIPLNVLDQRFIREISSAKEAGKQVFVRSVFLQGVLTLSCDQLVEKNLTDLVPFVSAFQDQSNKIGKSYAQAALSFARSLDVCGAVVGFDTVRELSAAAVESEPLSKDEFEGFLELSLPKRELVDPRKW
jgi:aryl-alcohol dehydrogenase-like predicted oxidoreductase